MLKRERRISKEAFKSLGKPDIFSNSGFLSAKIWKTGFKSKFSFSISKKNEKSAVLRNKARRVGYCSVEKIMESVKKGFVVQFIFNSKPKYEEIDRNVSEILNKSGIL